MLVGCSRHKEVRLIYPPIQIIANPTKKTAIWTKPIIGLRSIPNMLGRAPIRKTRNPASVRMRPTRARRCQKRIGRVGVSISDTCVLEEGFSAEVMIGASSFQAGGASFRPGLQRCFPHCIRI
jgi:hypothetical protein